MKYLLTVSALLCLTISSVRANDPTAAVVRIPSHGISAVVIATEPGRSFILSCAHGFTDDHERPSAASRAKPIVLDVPVPLKGAPQKVGVKLIDIDYEADLSLIQLDYGPLPYVCPVRHNSRFNMARCLSVGYDHMRQQAVKAPAHVLLTKMTYTQENPVPGRSGGGLIDLDSGCLVGVCQGYETSYKRRGMYVGHDDIVRFLTRKQQFRWTGGQGSNPSTETPPLPPPVVSEERSTPFVQRPFAAPIPQQRPQQQQPRLFAPRRGDPNCPT